MKKIFISVVLVSLCSSQSPEVRKYKQDIKTSFGKEKVDAINNLVSHRGGIPEFHDENRKLILESLSLADSLKYAEGRVDSWLGMSSLYSHEDSIKKYVEKADLVSDAIGYKRGIAEVLRKYAVLAVKKKDYVSALDKAKKAEAIYQTINLETHRLFVDWQASTLNQISNIYFSMGDVSTALNYNLKAMDILTDNNDHSNYRASKNLAIRNYAELERYRKSLSLSLELIDESIIYGDSTNFSNGIYRVSYAYRNLGILDSAVAFSRKVLELDIILNNHDFIMSDYSLIGDIYFEMNELDSALVMYKKTFLSAQENQNVTQDQKINFVTKTKIDLGRTYLKKNNNDLALELLLDGLDLAIEHNQKQYLSFGYESLYQYYKKTSMYKKALENYEAYITQKELISGQEAQNKLSNLEVQKEVSRSESELSVLEQKSQIQDLEISRQKTIRNAFASVGLLIIALGLALYYNIRARNKTLEEENKRKQEELEAALQLQLSMLPKENPETESYISAASMNAAETVGGDYYDFFPQSDGSVYVVCGDATGHGMAAGMVVSMTKTGLETIATETPNKLLGKLNEIIRKMKTGRNQMALSVVKLDKNNLEYSSAAMPPTYLFRQSDQSINELYATGLPLGALEKESYDLIEETMDTGDVLVMLSDGLPERTNTLNVQLDYPAVEKCVQEHAHKSPSEIINELERLGDSFSNGEPHADDITIVVLKKK
jgi:serine phosphatase RsbU (regulator of sigma subunit)